MSSTIKNKKYIVGIGASAGGLEAIHEFFDHLPSGSNLAFVIVQHLSSDYKSLLVELVAKHTHMKVFEAGNDMIIRQDCVYIIPNNKLMTVEHGKLKLSTRGDNKSPNTAIDTFFRSLAKDQKEHAVAVILSGTGTDGTKGIEMIRECGGMVMVQEPDSAKFDGMPNSAISSGNADFILLPKDMPRELFHYVNQIPVNVMRNGKIDDEHLDEIIGLVYRENGHDFNFYKTPTIIRRIVRRMNERNVHELKEYVELLKEDTKEVRLLGKDFLIGVTSFFRDPAAFAQLESTVLPEIISRKHEGDSIKVWVCACSTGEEAYSIAILLNKLIESTGRDIDIKLFATDVDEGSLDIAAKNQFQLSIANDVPADLLERYFIRDHDHYSVIPQIRKQIVFARHDVIKSPPFIKNDLITCRNMLIYMNGILQQKILATFHFSLLPDSFLFLGSSETGNSLKEGFTEVSSKWKIYKRSGFINYSQSNSYQLEERRILRPVRKPVPSSDPASLLEEDFQRFLSRDLGFAGVYLDKSYVIRHVVGNYKNFLSLPDNQIELNILKMVPKTVAVVLNTAIRQSIKENRTVHIGPLKMGKGNKEKLVNISVREPGTDQPAGYTLLAFSECFQAPAPSGRGDKSPEHSNSNDELVLALEAELNETRNNLQMAVEEMETTNEELQSSNEELLSANEELQSSNEELQSLNEELHTLNTEHQVKIRELVELNDDLDNYFRGIDVGLVFLNSSLTIRKFNPAATNMINLIDADNGRSIEHISTNVLNEDLSADIHQVLADNITIEKEVTLKNGLHCLMRIMPYLRKDKTRDGVVLSFVDITEIITLNSIIAGVFNASSSGIFAFEAVRNRNGKVNDFTCIACNDAGATFLGREKEQIEHGSLVQNLPELIPASTFNRYADVVTTGTTHRSEMFLNEKWFEVICVKMEDGFVLNLMDTTAAKTSEQKLRKNFNELIETRETLRKLNASLEDRIAARTRELSESEERFKLVSTATNDTIWDWDLAANTLWRNENFNLMFGYTLNKVSSNTDFWFNKIHPDDREAVRKGVYDAINRKHDQWSDRYRFQKADGQYAYVLDRGRILKDEYNTPYRMVGSTLDITKLIETEKKLTLSQSKFRKIFESNVIGMTFASLKTGRVLEANKAFLEMIGYSIGELTARTWVDITPPEFTEVTQKALNELRTHGFSRPYEKQYFRKNGERMWILAAASVLDENDPDEIVTYIIDITTQKENERKKNDLQNLIIKQKDQFYNMFKYAPALITIRTGPELRYQFVNQAFKKFDGKRNYIGKTAEEAGSSFVYHELDRISLEVLHTGIPYSAQAAPITRNIAGQKSEETWYDFAITPVYTDEGKIEGVAFFGFDVTDLVKGKAAVQELMYRKDEFLSIASHELKTPITSIKLSLQIADRMLKADKKPADLRHFIEKAKRQGDKLNDLVSDLLDVTKIQAGKMQFNYTEFDARTLLTQAVDEAQYHSEHEIRIRHNAHVMLNADMNRIEQVIDNFISNAIKYSPDANMVEVSTSVNKGRYRLSVKDHGIGIPKEKQEQIFDRFYRVQESSVKFSGLGLGLYISAEIIRRHNGTIGVNSEEGKGSEFWFEIPLGTE